MQDINYPRRINFDDALRRFFALPNHRWMLDGGDAHFITHADVIRAIGNRIEEERGSCVSVQGEATRKSRWGRRVKQDVDPRDLVHFTFWDAIRAFVVSVIGCLTRVRIGNFSKHNSGLRRDYTPLGQVEILFDCWLGLVRTFHSFYAKRVFEGSRDIQGWQDTPIELVDFNQLVALEPHVSIEHYMDLQGGASSIPFVANKDANDVEEFIYMNDDQRIKEYCNTYPQPLSTLRRPVLMDQPSKPWHFDPSVQQMLSRIEQDKLALLENLATAHTYIRRIVVKFKEEPGSQLALPSYGEPTAHQKGMGIATGRLLYWRKIRQAFYEKIVLPEHQKDLFGYHFRLAYVTAGIDFLSRYESIRSSAARSSSPVALQEEILPDVYKEMIEWLGLNLIELTRYANRVFEVADAYGWAVAPPCRVTSIDIDTYVMDSVFQYLPTVNSEEPWTNWCCLGLPRAMYVPYNIECEVPMTRFMHAFFSSASVFPERSGIFDLPFRFYCNDRQRVRFPFWNANDINRLHLQDLVKTDVGGEKKRNRTDATRHESRNVNFRILYAFQLLIIRAFRQLAWPSPFIVGSWRDVALECIDIRAIQTVRNALQNRNTTGFEMNPRAPLQAPVEVPTVVPERTLPRVPDHSSSPDPNTSNGGTVHKMQVHFGQDESTSRASHTTIQRLVDQPVHNATIPSKQPVTHPSGSGSRMSHTIRAVQPRSGHSHVQRGAQGDDGRNARAGPSRVLVEEMLPAETSSESRDGDGPPHAHDVFHGKNTKHGENSPRKEGSSNERPSKRNKSASQDRQSIHVSQVHALPQKVTTNDANRGMLAERRQTTATVVGVMTPPVIQDNGSNVQLVYDPNILAPLPSPAQVHAQMQAQAQAQALSSSSLPSYETPSSDRRRQREHERQATMGQTQPVRDNYSMEAQPAFSRTHAREANMGVPEPESIAIDSELEVIDLTQDDADNELRVQKPAGQRNANIPQPNSKRQTLATAAGSTAQLAEAPADVISNQERVGKLADPIRPPCFSCRVNIEMGGPVFTFNCCGAEIHTECYDSWKQYILGSGNEGMKCRCGTITYLDRKELEANWRRMGGRPNPNEEEDLGRAVQIAAQIANQGDGSLDAGMLNRLALNQDRIAQNPNVELCCYCMEPLNPTIAEGQPDVEPDSVLWVLQCGHVFHRVCVLQSWNFPEPDQHKTFLAADQASDADMAYNQTCIVCQTVHGTCACCNPGLGHNRARFIDEEPRENGTIRSRNTVDYRFPLLAQSEEFMVLACGRHLCCQPCLRRQLEDAVFETISSKRSAVKIYSTNKPRFERDVPRYRKDVRRFLYSHFEMPALFKASGIMGCDICDRRLEFLETKPYWLHYEPVFLNARALLMTVSKIYQTMQYNLFDEYDTRCMKTEVANRHSISLANLHGLRMVRREPVPGYSVDYIVEFESQMLVLRCMLSAVIVHTRIFMLALTKYGLWEKPGGLELETLLGLKDFQFIYDEAKKGIDFRASPHIVLMCRTFKGLFLAGHRMSQELSRFADGSARTPKPFAVDYDFVGIVPDDRAALIEALDDRFELTTILNSLAQKVDTMSKLRRQFLFSGAPCVKIIASNCEDNDVNWLDVLFPPNQR